MRNVEMQDAWLSRESNESRLVLSVAKPNMRYPQRKTTSSYSSCRDVGLHKFSPTYVLARRLLGALSVSPEKGQALRQAAQRTARERYSLEAGLAQYLQLIGLPPNPASEGRLALSEAKPNDANPPATPENGLAPGAAIVDTRTEEGIDHA